MTALGVDVELNGRMEMPIYIVTYWDEGKEPVVTAFDNKDAAEYCYRAFRDCHDGCCMDETTVYHSFNISD